MIRRAFRLRECPCCGQTLGASMYPPTKSPFFPDGHLTICGDCLDNELRDMNGEWAMMDYICQWADVPFIPEQFTKIWNSAPEHAASQYIKLFSQRQYDKLHWETYEQRWKEAVKNKQEELIHPVFNAAELDRMRKDWGNGYSDEDLYQLENLYNGMKLSFGISDPAREDNARKMCKISLEIDRCIANGAQGLDKLVAAYQKIQTMGGFLAEDAQDYNNFSSISELTLYMEKLGWKKKFHNDETRDVVDSTMKNIQSYNRRLYQSESTIADQIDDVIAAKQRMDALENDIMDNEIDHYEVEGITDLDDKEEMEDFDPSIDD